MKIKLLIFAILLVGCNNNSGNKYKHKDNKLGSYEFSGNILENIPQEPNTIRIQRDTYDKIFLFKLRINKDFYYYDSSGSNCPNGTTGWPICEYSILNKDSIHIYVKINNSDSQFYFNTKNVTKIRFGICGMKVSHRP